MRLHRVAAFLKWPAFVILGMMTLLWTIAGSDRLFLKAVPLEQRLVSHNETIRRKAQQELLGLSPDTKRTLTAKLIPALVPDDRFVSKWAAIALALMGPAAQDAIPALLAGVSAKERDFAQACRVALNEIGAPDVAQLPSLLAALRDPHAAVRCEAASTIAKMGPAADEAIPALVQDVMASPSVPECTGNALAALGPAAQDPLLALLSDPSPAVRRNASYVLSRMAAQTPQVLHVLFKVLGEDAESEVRQMAARALTLPQTPERGLVPTLVYSLRRAQAPDVRRAALLELHATNTRWERALPVIARAQRDSEAAMRCLAARQLVEMGASDRVAVPILIEDLKTEDPASFCAGQALGMAGLFNPEVVPALVALLGQKDPDLRSRAAHVLLGLGGRAREALPALQNAQKDQVPGAEIAIKAIREALPRPARRRR